MSIKRSSILRWAIALAILGAAVWLLRDVDAAALMATLRSASTLPLALAVALNLTLNLGARTLRWRSLLPPSPRTGRPVRFASLVSILATGQAANIVLPLRAGEAVRTLALVDREGYGVREVIAAQAVEKLVELASLLTIALPIALSPAFVGRFAALLALGVAGVLALVVLRRVRWRVLGEIAAALHVVGHPARLVRSYGWALASDLVDLATIGLSLAAVHLATSPLAWCAVFVAVNIAIAVPSTPGQIGVLEAGAVLALTPLGIDHDRALAFAILYHAVHVVPFTLAGGVALASGRAPCGSRSTNLLPSSPPSGTPTSTRSRTPRATS